MGIVYTKSVVFFMKMYVVGKVFNISIYNFAPFIELYNIAILIIIISVKEIFVKYLKCLINII